MNTIDMEKKIAKERQKKISIKELGFFGFIYACGTELLMMSGLKKREALEENFKRHHMEKDVKRTPHKGESHGFGSRREFKNYRKADRKRRGKKSCKK